MRILQLIDSLRPGGAERMAVNYANALSKHIESSYLCCTRTEGLLQSQLSPKVDYLFLNKNSTLDRKAFLKLRSFINENRIDLIQAHGSSWFLAFMVKLSLPGLKLIWHDHYGRELQQRRLGLLKPASQFFDGIIAVNKDLEEYSRKNLYSREVRYFRNFLSETSGGGEKTKLKGGDSFKIICVANWRPQKDHFTLLVAFAELLQENPNISLHLVGKDNEDAYSQKILAFLKEHQLEEKVFLYGEQEEVSYLLEHADIGILSSESEGLPVALLEYGRSGLPVICTSVGECSEVVGRHGRLIPPKNPKAMAAAVLFYIESETERKKNAMEFHRKIMAHYSEGAVIPDVINFLYQF